MKGSLPIPFPRNLAGRELVRVIAGVGTIAGVMAVAITWRVAHRPEAASFLPILGWQFLIWLPWVGLYYVVRQLVRRLGTYQDATLVGLTLHILAAILIASTHLFWFWQVSSRTSPFLDAPDTRFGAFAFFFVFWFLMDLLLYWAILARPEPDQRAQESLAGDATTDSTNLTGGTLEILAGGTYNAAGILRRPAHRLRQFLVAQITHETRGRTGFGAIHSGSSFHYRQHRSCRWPDHQRQWFLPGHAGRW